MNFSSENTPRSAGRPKDPIPREKMLKAARKAFAEAGYAGASMAHIAELIGIRKASLFHHFPTKDALYNEVVFGVTSDLGALVSAANEAPTDFLHRLDDLGVRIVTYLGENPASARVLLREFVDRGAFKGEPHQNVAVQTLKIAASFLEEGMKAGLLKKQDPEHLALTLVGVHLTFFATPELSQHVLGKEIFTPSVIQERVHAVVLQVRRICGAPALPSNWKPPKLDVL